MTADDEVTIRQKTATRPRGQSAYMTLLSSLATDLDLMLNDLRSTPPRFIQTRSSLQLPLGQLSTSVGPDTTSFKSRRFQLDSVDSEDGGGQHGDDDLQTLLPASRGASREDLSQSHASLVSSSDGGILAEGEETSTDTASGDSASPPCDLGLVERLLRTHPVWFLPGIQRAGAVHLLQGKEEGNFVVRGSSQPNTMAVSVRLPPNTGPYIEHYLIQSNDGLLSLESSRFKFNSIPALIAHYAQCCDELPVQLTLPRALREAKNRQQLSSLALLGQEFWRYPMASPRPSKPNVDSPMIPIFDQIEVSSTVFGVAQSSMVVNPQSSHPFSSQAIETPMSDTTSSLSSFTPNGAQQLLSPESIDSVVLTMSPVESTRTGIVGKMSTFKALQKPSQSSDGKESPPSVFAASNPFSVVTASLEGVRAPRPTPPNTLNLAPLRTPPAPPPRWSKPPTPNSPNAPNASSTLLDQATSTASAPNNFTVTTTVTFSVDNHQTTPQILEVTSPTTNATFQTISKRLSPEGECKTTAGSTDTSTASKQQRWQQPSAQQQQQQQTSKDSIHQTKILSPTLAETPTGRTRRSSKARKESSKHYQESDILESPSVYCRSTLGDKISDYEDIWSQENNQSLSTPLIRGAGHLSSFRPETTTTVATAKVVTAKRPDLLSETPTITSLNGNLLSPAGSMSSSNPSPPHSSGASSQPAKVAMPQIVDEQFEEKTSFCDVDDEQVQLRESSDSLNDQKAIPPVAQSTPIVDQSNPMLQPRNRLGLILPLGTQVSPVVESPTTPLQTPGTTRNKQGSPFYAEPADALGNVLRRGPPTRAVPLPVNQRYSEPPKGPPRMPQCPAALILSPMDAEKSQLAGSLDELKKKYRKARGRLDPWPLDSSWEFMGNDQDDNDYDSDMQWRAGQKVAIQKEAEKPPIEATTRMTVHQIISRRMPDLNLPELVRCSTPSTNVDNANTLGKVSRISAYDNVERGGGQSGGYASSGHHMNSHDSTHSDDGTVFSEPWDSSQWDSFLPQDDMSDTIHMSKCRSVVGHSEDDTIMEESSMTAQHKSGGQPQSFVLRETKSQQKIATILRTRSCRDREILCHPRNRQAAGGPGESIGAYALTLAADKQSTFARNIENFISCTRESREVAPQVVMRNMRQFMSGMKNYLVKHGEGDFQREVLLARSRLKSDEFLNLDTILEGVMHQLVVLPLREHLYGLFVDYYTRTGDIQLLVENVRYASGRTSLDFGIRASVVPPTASAMRQISTLLVRLQEAEQPLEKLEILLAAVSSIFEATGCSRGQQLSADDFLPLLVFVVAKSGFIGAEIEAEFMWGLLQPSLLSGEAGYYLTALCSAVHVLKSFMASDSEGTGSLDWRSSSLPACSSVLRVIIPDECNGSLQTRTLPVRPHTTTREVCRIIAHKARITNPQDYALFKLVNGEETLLLDAECPQDARIAARGKHCMLAYKRIDAKIAWPTSTGTNFA